MQALYVLNRNAVIQLCGSALRGRPRDGQGMAEYGLIMAGVALLALVAVFVLGPKIGYVYNQVGMAIAPGNASIGFGSMPTP